MAKSAIKKTYNTKEEKLAIAAKLMVPSYYAEQRLGLKLHPIQKKVLNSLFEKEGNKVSFRAGNGVGKTSHVIVSAILYGIEMLNCNVISTAAVYRQISKQLVPNLRTHAHLFPGWEFQDNPTIKIKGESKYTGIATSEDSKFQGFHSSPGKPLLIIVDEAAGVKDEIYQSIGRCQPTYLLIAGSPLSPEGIFYKIETDINMSEQYEHYKLSQFDCLKEDGYWLDRKDIENFISMWGGSNVLIQSSVYAEFATDTEDCIITLSDLERSFRNTPIPDFSNGKHVTLDFAAGGAENVIAFRNGNSIKIIKAWREKDTMKAAREIVSELDILRQKHGIIASQVSGDADGLGIVFIDKLKELGWNINRFHGNSTPNDTAYKNKITECWLEMARNIRNGSLSIPNDQEFKLQLTSRKQYMHSSGKLMIESKADMASRNIPSPDRADAIAMAASNPNSGNLTFIKTIPRQSYKPTFF